MLFTDPRNHHAKDPAVVRFHGYYYMYYSTWEGELTHLGIGIARSENLTDWTVIGDFPETQPCEQNGTGAPGAIVLDGKVHLFYQTYGNGRKDAICHAVSIPVAAIGGIDRHNIPELAGTGISGVAVVSGIFAASDIEAECRCLRSLVNQIIK